MLRRLPRLTVNWHWRLIGLAMTSGSIISTIVWVFLIVFITNCIAYFWNKIELDRTAYDRDIPKVATMLKDGGGVLISTCPTREAVKRGWVCALLPPVSWGRVCLEV